MSSRGNSDAAASDSASAPEKSATSTAARPAPAAVSALHPKLRSCAVCRRRKVRCDKVSPCSNCRRANIACVFPSDDRPPRWARRLERLTNDTGSASVRPSSGPDAQTVQVMERLHGLEGLVKELRSQLERANSPNTAAGSEGGGSASSASSPQAAGSQSRSVDQYMGTSSIVGTADVQNQFGRLVLKDADRSRYVSSGFWSRVDDEIEKLKMDLVGDESDSSQEDIPPKSAPSTQELDRTPSERHGFLFRHNLGSSPSDTHEFHPLPSQIPFLLNTYSENVNLFVQVVHMPTVTNIARGSRGSSSSSLAPSDEALLFAIYYAAIISMEDDDVITNFGITKGELSLKYRLGLEHAFAKADFLNNPDLTLVQAFDIFLALARRHDSPRFVWMMTGLAIRMAQSLGLHRDGSHFPQLSPYEVEIRRRAWWTLCFLDVRSSEDQGMDYSIVPGSFDTEFPRNIIDSDISPETRETPPERQGLTAMTIPIDMCRICAVTRQIMDKERAPTVEEQRRLVNELYRTIERGHLQYSKESDGNITWWVSSTAIRLTMAKMTLFINFPVLFSSGSVDTTIDIRNRLLVAAIEVAEWNHALNAEHEARQWRWVYQTYTHWNAIVLLLIEIARRPLSPIVERAWLALRSSWLIPANGEAWTRKLQIWIPLRRLMAQARKHRDAEINRLRSNVQAIEETAAEDSNIPIPASLCPFLSQEELQEHWRNLFTSYKPTGRTQASTSVPMEDSSRPAIVVQGVGMPTQRHIGSLPSTHGWDHDLVRTSALKSQSSPGVSAASEYNLPTLTTNERAPNFMGSQDGQVFGHDASSPFTQGTATWSGLQHFDSISMPWLWADADPTTDVFGADLDINMDGETDWQDWLESARNIELNPDTM